ncbi:Transport protein particle [Wickerhamomyces ciferrii]|uniref:Transport protein particle n=1 Tax=Wickerhamomyces ciferrii (strain ATCC 14091 / BCRC 22168 / CBS 111 / JCM 3599 / NBRC 0793 / NRRL Y-1031 F-60-10) TaxID=1206466 RepID=K0KEZ6_WICCF|nr:Transport protein particle [Wickerhamomyces ciferrii]CCH41531.1 Transport protein particle [Wickerhamomyces ciferrii]
MESYLSISNLPFFLDRGITIDNLVEQKQSNVASKKTSIDCKRLVTCAFSPQITVTSSANADNLASDFGFHSFFQLLKPFGDHIQHKFQIKDSQLVSRTADDFSVRFTRPLSDLLSIQEAEIKERNKVQLFNQHSFELLLGEYIQAINPHLRNAQKANDIRLQSTLKSSMYIKFFTKLLSSSLLTSFESLNHPVASFIVISADDPYDEARRLLIEFKSTKVPDFMNIEDILPLFIIVYDEVKETDQQKAFQLKDHIKKQLFTDAFTLGISTNKEAKSQLLSPPVLSSIDEELQNTHLTSIGNPTLPVSTITSIYQVLKDVIQRKLIPFMEKKIATWDDQVITPRKSLTGRFFSVSKKYFGKNPQNNNEQSSNYNIERGSYGFGAVESLTRKLADWSFMLRDYRYAYTSYELAKKDFLSDKAWAHLASCQEMAAISLLMGATNITSKIKNDTIDPLVDSSNYTFLSRCGLKTYALRSILIVSELFCTLRDGWTSAPAALKWVQKAIDDKSVGKIGRSLLLERMSYINSIYMSSQAKIILSKKAQDNEKENEEDKDKEEYEPIFNEQKIVKENMGTIGFTNNRKAALWNLLAAKDWDPVSQPLQVQICLNSTEDTYGGKIFAERDSSLYQRLLTVSQKHVRD